MKWTTIAGLVVAGIVAFAGVLVTRQEQAQAPVVTEDEQVYEVGHNGVSSPSVRKQVDPKYTEAARAAKITGVVHLEAVVEPDGHVNRVSVTRSLDSKYGLDDEAIKALKQWEFFPSKKDGKPVAVWIKIELVFPL